VTSSNTGLAVNLKPFTLTLPVKVAGALKIVSALRLSLFGSIPALLPLRINPAGIVTAEDISPAGNSTIVP
jgi:hypothetical protein